MNIYSEITPEILSLTKLAESTSKIDPALYTKYDVKRGLRDINGKGVLAGLTDIGNVHAYDMVDGKQVPCEGKLYYRGYNIEDLVNGFIRDQRFGFEEVTYLLLFGKLPSKEDLKEFSDMLAAYRSLPTSFVRDIILKAPSQDMMNTLARSVLTLYTYDDRADDISLPNVLRQCLQLIALLDAADFVAAFQKRQGLYISCIEEIAYKRGFITKEQLVELAQPLLKTAYGRYLLEIAEGL